MNDAEPDLGRLRAWLNKALAEPIRDISLEKFAGGQSNPTYRLCTDKGDYVLRRKPFGALLPKAHMIEREVRVLSALRDLDVPVPKILDLCEDPTIIGSPFYVMELVEGRIYWDPRLPDMVPTERAALFDAMNDAAARLHRIDPIEAGLGDFGRAEGFLRRQVKLWTAQYHASEMQPIPAMDALIAWLPLHMPDRSDMAIFHGDLRMDNLVFHPTEPRVLAILDWELSTLGDPIADFAYNAMVWHIPPDLFRGLAGIDHAKTGVPTVDAYCEAYARRTGRMEMPHWNFYLAFAMFRVAAMLQGIARRAADGNASASDAAELGARAGPLAAIGLAIAEGGAR